MSSRSMLVIDPGNSRGLKKHLTDYNAVMNIRLIATSHLHVISSMGPVV